MSKHYYYETPLNLNIDIDIKSIYFEIMWIKQIYYSLFSRFLLLFLCALSFIAINPITAVCEEMQVSQARPRVTPEDQQKADARKRANQKSKTARRLELRGDYKSALSVYEQLHSQYPEDPTYFDAIIRSLSALTLYDEAAGRLEERIRNESGKSNPAALFAELGAVHFQAGRENQAEIDWQQSLNAIPGSTGSYLALAQVFIRLRLADRAVEILRKGRSELGDPDLFAMNLASLLQSRMDWKGAAEEFLLTLGERSTRKSYVLRSLANFPNNEIANEAVATAIRGKLEETKDKEPWQGYRVTCREILMEQYMKNGDYDSAVEILAEIAGEEKKPWKRLVSFAADAQAEGALNAAERALEIASKKWSTPEERASVDIALAGIAIDREQYEKADSLLSLYCELESNVGVEIRAILQRGLLYLEKLNDPQSALADFNVLLQNPALGDIDLIRYAGGVALARLDSLEAADSLLNEVGRRILPRNRNRRRQPSVRGNRSIISDAVFLRARIAWWSGELDSAIKLLDSLTAHPEGADAENDAFVFTKLLNAGSEDKKSLVKLGEADKAKFDMKYEEAHNLYIELSEDSLSSLAPEASWQAAFLELAIFPEDSAKTLQAFVKRFPDHSRAEEAWFELGNWWESTGDTEEAISSFEALLINYPEGLLSAEARLRLDHLSGQELPPLLPEPTIDTP
ncbi:MAG: tetratricopeptide repeat protein [Candidatus Electryonea clarkiae]|nr:tetratricopeptide repeat protein [Candidatus Electryonea clarkiae]